MGGVMGEWAPIPNLLPGAGIYVADPSVPYRGVVHTTESPGTFTPAPRTYYGHTSWPHLTVAYRVEGGARVARTWQHGALNLAARAARNLPGGVETNRMRAVQIELAWRAADIEHCPVDLLDELARAMRYVEASVGVRPRFAVFHPYPPPDGIRLDGREPWRMTPGQWRSFDGWCGHQHLPENLHGDPGALPLDRLYPPATPTEAIMRFPNAVHATRCPTGGVWVLGRDGGVGAYGGAPFHGSYPSLPAEGRMGEREFLAIEANDRGGYDLLADDGAAYSFPIS